MPISVDNDRGDFLTVVMKVHVLDNTTFVYKPRQRKTVLYPKKPVRSHKLHATGLCKNKVTIIYFVLLYRNDPKFSDRQVWANSADPDQTAPRGAV